MDFIDLFIYRKSNVNYIILCFFKIDHELILLVNIVLHYECSMILSIKLYFFGISFLSQYEPLNEIFNFIGYVLFIFFGTYQIKYVIVMNSKFILQPNFKFPFITVRVQI
jgi:hypothetical protein